MKKLFYLLVLLSLNFLYAYEAEFGKLYKSYNYNEYSDNSVLLDSELADLGEISGWYFQLHFTLSDSSSLKLYYDKSAGYTTYIGSSISGGAYGSIVSQTVNYFTTISMKYDYIYASGSEWDLRLLASGGTYTWDRLLSTIQEEIYHWYFSDIGLDYAYHIDDTMTWGAVYAYRQTIKPQMDVNAPSLVPYTVLDLGNSYGTTVSLYCNYQLDDPHFTIKVRYNYEHFLISKSNIRNGILEPKSTQVNSYLYFGISYGF